MQSERRKINDHYSLVTYKSTYKDCWHYVNKSIADSNSFVLAEKYIIFMSTGDGTYSIKKYGREPQSIQGYFSLENFTWIWTFRLVKIACICTGTFTFLFIHHLTVLYTAVIKKLITINV